MVPQGRKSKAHTDELKMESDIVSETGRRANELMG